MYTRAERWWWSALGCVVLGVVASALLTRSFIPSGGATEVLLLIVSVTTPALAALARRRSGDCAARADLCRRAFLYREALGEEPSVEERRIVALWPANTPLNRVTTEHAYFSSTEGIGAARLADAVGESAFYTAELARVMALGGYVLFGVSFFILLAAVIALASLSLDGATLGQFKTAVGLVAIVMLTLVTAEILMTTLAYTTLARACREVSKSASLFRELTHKSVVTAVRLAESYSIALAGNFPIPNLIYRWNHGRIDRAYRSTLVGP
jgi:hypothetical protein